RRAWLLARSAFWHALADRLVDRNVARRFVAIDRPISVLATCRLQISPRFSMARPGRPSGLDLDGPGRDRGERGSGECGGEQQFRGASDGCSRSRDRWSGELVE